MRLNHRRRLSVESLETRVVLAASVDIPDDLTATPGSQVVAQVRLQEGAGTRGAEVRLSYDPAVLTLQESDVLAGAVWGAGAQVVANVDPAAGTLVAFVFSAEPFTGGNGSLLDVRFGVRSTAVAGSSTTLDLTKVQLNEGQIIVSPAPQAGADASDGRITIVGSTGGGGGDGSARIAGFVFADANQNNLRDSAEGIPLVMIELLSGNGSVVATTQTDSQGSYRFEGLAAGNYTIRQAQPLAYIDGGNNSVSVTLADQQNLVDQNFRELGLKAAYIFNAFLSTPVQPAGSPAWISLLNVVHAAAGSAVSAGSVVSTSETQLFAAAPAISQMFSASDNSTGDDGDTAASGSTMSMLTSSSLTQADDTSDILDADDDMSVPAMLPEGEAEFAATPLVIDGAEALRALLGSSVVVDASTAIETKQTQESLITTGTEALAGYVQLPEFSSGNAVKSHSPRAVDAAVESLVGDAWHTA